MQNWFARSGVALLQQFLLFQLSPHFVSTEMHQISSITNPQ